MPALHSDTAILVDPGVREAGFEVDTLVAALAGLVTKPVMLVLGLARHPELLTRAVKVSGARRAVVVTAELGHPPIALLRTWGAAGGLAPLGIQVVALDILRARRSALERSTYARRMVAAAVAALDAPDTARAARRPVGDSLSRRALLSGRATTWVPVVEVDTSACLGTLRCQRCIQTCPEDALQIRSDVASAAPMVDVSRCGACSRCLDTCPTGALSLDGHDPATLVKRLQALLQSDAGGRAPSLIISCQSAADPVHRLGKRGGLPGWLVLELTCLGGIGSTWHLAALAAGAPTVQILPCERCLDSAFLAKQLRFTRTVLTALGDGQASRRVGVLPARGTHLKRAILAAAGLIALVDRTGADRMPAPDSIKSSAQVAAWAVGELQRASGTAVRDQDGQPVVIHGDGAPLGWLRAVDGCTACGVCARTCPTRALSLSAALGCTELVLDPTACTGCALCVQTCPEGVLEAVPGVDLALLMGGCEPIARSAVADCPDCGELVPALPAAAHLTGLPAGLVGRCPRCRQAALVASI